MNPKHWNLLLSDRLNSLNPSDQYAAYSMAYLDSAERLCGLLSRSYRSATYERGTVVLYLAMHAVELFLKGAILRKAPHERLVHHNLERIYNRYKELYPAKRYHFDMGFTKNYSGMSKKEIQTARQYSPPIDQLFRYPQDKNSTPWPSLYAFEANSFLAELESLRMRFMQLLETYKN